MKKVLPYSFIIVLGSTLLLVMGCTSLQPEDVDLSTEVFAHNGIERNYIYYAPAQLAPGAPLVVVLHGFTSSAKNIMSYTGFNKLADENNFAVVYPQGTQDHQSRTFWNVGYEFHADVKTDDLDFIAKLVSSLQTTHSLSKQNTFATGMSNGGEMCYLLACTYPDMFAAVAPVAGTMMSNRFDACKPAHSIPMLAIVGNADNTTNYQGDEQNADGWGAYKSIPSIIGFWTNYMEYDALRIDTLPDRVETDSSFVVRSTYTSKEAKNEFLYFEVVGGGHDWPGAWGNEDIDASKEIWNFFRRYLEEDEWQEQ